MTRTEGVRCMRRLLLACAALGAMALATPAGALTLLYDFSSFSGVLGPTQTYTSAGATISATGCLGNCLSPNQINLFGKALGGDENGLGIHLTTDNEIEGLTLVQVDVTSLLGKGLDPSQTAFQMGSTTGS